MHKELYLVGHHLTDSNEFGWECIGVFDNKELAVDNCLDGDYFYVQIELNKIINHDFPYYAVTDPVVIFNNMVYPLNKQNE